MKLENISLVKRVYFYIKKIYKDIELIISKNKKIYKIVGTHDRYNFIRLKNLIEKIDKKKFTTHNHLVGFIRGVFLTSGYAKPPNKEYALDFFIRQKKIANLILEKLLKLNFKAHFTTNDKINIVYLRNYNDIEELLLILGAQKSYYEYTNSQIMKELRKKEIRKLNWEISNETKIITAAEKQIELIKKIDKKIGIRNLNKILAEAAYLRLEFPDASLQELADKLNLSKSGFKNRLKRLEIIYEKKGKNVE